MKSLLLDVGNSRLKWGIAEHGAIHRTGHITQEKIRDCGLQVLTTRLPRRVDRVLASNVAGTSFATRLSGLVSAHCNCDVHFAKTEKQAFGISNGYKQPRRLGVDRWVAMIGAYAEFGAACLVVDAGTAVTIDAFDDGGAHLGGQILPGASLMANALSSSTSDIPKIGKAGARSRVALDMFAEDTANAVREGALNAVTGAVERSIRVLRSNAYDPVLVLTGGDASRILSALDEHAEHRPNLVLQGLMHMLERGR
jgi:type III pantothenate kinase